MHQCSLRLIPRSARAKRSKKQRLISITPLTSGRTTIPIDETKAKYNLIALNQEEDFRFLESLTRNKKGTGSVDGWYIEQCQHSSRFTVDFKKYMQQKTNNTTIRELKSVLQKLQSPKKHDTPTKSPENLPTQTDKLMQTITNRRKREQDLIAKASKRQNCPKIIKTSHPNNENELFVDHALNQIKPIPILPQQNQRQNNHVNFFKPKQPAYIRRIAEISSNQAAEYFENVKTQKIREPKRKYSLQVRQMQNVEIETAQKKITEGIQLEKNDMKFVNLETRLQNMRRNRRQRTLYSLLF